MPQQKLTIENTAETLTARLDISSTSPRGRLYALLSNIALAVFADCALLFMPGKHGTPSMWDDLSLAPVDSFSFVFAVVSLLIFPLLLGLGIWRYLIMAYPSDERFTFDGSHLIVSKVYWLDFSNGSWETQTYSLGEISRLRYQAVARAKAITIYGLRFEAQGKSHRVLPGLKAREAEKILNALEDFGFSVVFDPALSEKIKEEAHGWTS